MISADVMESYPVLAGYRSRMISAKDAVRLAKAGNQVYLGTGCATPRLLAEALKNLSGPPAAVTLHHFLPNGTIPRKEGDSMARYGHRCYFLDGTVRAAVARGLAEYIPISLAQVPQLIDNGRIVIDVALIQVSPPDEFGYVSLGVSVDVAAAVVRHARCVIAEINPNMPRTMGDSFVHLGRFEAMVWSDAPLAELQPKAADAVSEQVGEQVASLIEDGATLQIGPGHLPNAMLKHLAERRDLGVHTDVITDALVELLEKGVITGRQKTRNRGMIVASYCLGTRRLYDQIDRNPLFSFRPIEVVCDLPTIVAQHKMVSVTQACAVDLSGQVCADLFEGEFCSGAPTQLEFMKGAALSPGGKPIVCMRSTSEDGKVSHIRPQLLAAEGVTVARTDVHYVVTEYGIAYLFGKTMQERALELIRIAHPDFRLGLLKESKKLGYVKKGLVLRKPRYPAEEERSVLLRSQKTVLIRPTRGGDASALQQFFRSMSREDCYTRFFRRMNRLSDTEAQRLCHVDQCREVAFLALTGKKGNEAIIGSAFYFVNPTTNMAEVAYMVAPEWQGVGIGTALQLKLMEHARSRGLRGFTAEIQIYNANMINLAKSACDDISIQRHGDSFEVTMLFN